MKRKRENEAFGALGWLCISLASGKVFYCHVSKLNQMTDYGRRAAEEIYREMF
jgi:hypothetical protein